MAVLSLPPSHATQLRPPAPLDHLSAEEEREFPGAIIVEASEIAGPRPGEKTRLRLLKTHFKYPMIRTEEIIDDKTQQLVGRSEMVADHLLVTLPAGMDPQQFLKQCGSSAIAITRVTADAPLYRLDLKSASLDSLPAALQQMKANHIPAEADMMAHSYLVPNNPLYTAHQWGLWPSFYYPDPTVPFLRHLFNAGCDAEDAWDVQTSAASIVVAVVDSGIRYTHENLVGNIWENPAPTDDDKKGCSALDKDGNLICCGFNAYGDGELDNNGYHIPNGNPMDLSGHGTYVAGIIGATGNSGGGIAGVAWKVQLMACRHSDENGNIVVSDSIACIDYAVAQQARIINCSWGTGDACSKDLYDAMQRAQQAGVIIVAAAGNSGKNLDEMPDYPSSFAHDFVLSDSLNEVAPGIPIKGLDNIVAVTASTMANQLVPAATPEGVTPQSPSPYGVDYGPNTVHLVAPGWNIYGPYIYDIDANGQSVESDHGYANGGGTSAAAPFVTGTLALLAEIYRMEPYQALIGRLLASVDKTSAYEGKVITGGKLNIYKALTQNYEPLYPPLASQ